MGAEMSFKPILKFGAKRLLASIGILLGVSLLCFFVVECISVDTRIRRRFGLFGGYIDPVEYLERYNEFGFEMGLLEEDGTPIPVLKRYLQWLGFMRNNKGVYNGLFQGKLGESWSVYDMPVESIIKTKLWFSVIFNTACFIILTTVALIGGVIFFTKRDLRSNKLFKKKIGQRIVAIPVLLLSIFIIIIFSQVFGFNGIDFDSAIIEPFILSNEFYFHLFLPLLIMIIWSIVFVLRIISNNSEQILPKKYQTYMNYSGYTQKQKIGIIIKNQSSFILRYLRNNLSMIYSVLAILEIIFQLPGLGTLTVIYANERNIPGLLVSMILYSFMILVHKFLLEMILVCIDPRVLSGEINLNFATISNRWIHQS